MPIAIRQRVVDALDTLFKTILTTNYLTVHTFSAALAVTKISAVNGAAFLDCGAGGADLLAHLGEKVTITDSAGKAITGFIKAAGTGESYGAELVTAWTNSLTDPYDTFTAGVGPDMTQVANVTNNGLAASPVVSASGGLYKLSAPITLASGNNPRWQFGQTSGLAGAAWLLLGTGSLSNIYRVAEAAYTYFGFYNTLANGRATDFSLSGFSLKQVLTPAATGVTIVSASGGTTYNWTTKDAAFNYADASGYTVTIAAPYNLNLGSHVSWRRDLQNNPFQVSELPAMNCRDTNETTVRAIGQHEHALMIEAVIAINSSDDGETARKAIADVTRALGTNVSPNTCLGGYAEDISPITSEVFDEVHEGIKGFGVALQFAVQYVTAPFDPYTIP